MAAGFGLGGKPLQGLVELANTSALALQPFE